MDAPSTMAFIDHCAFPRALLLALLAIFAFTNTSLSYATVVQDRARAPMHDCGGPAPSGSGDCPCCTVAPGILAGCLSLCGSAALAGAPVLAVEPLKVRDNLRPSTAAMPPTRSYAPPNPPPIR